MGRKYAWVSQDVVSLQGEIGAIPMGGGQCLSIGFLGGKPYTGIWRNQYGSSVFGGDHSNMLTSPWYSNGSVPTGLDVGSVSGSFIASWGGPNSYGGGGGPGTTTGPVFMSTITMTDPDYNAWSLSYGSGSDADVTGTTFSATGPSLAFTPGDVLVVATWHPSDTAISGTSVTAAGITLSEFVTNPMIANMTTVGDDGAHYIHVYEVTAGTATVAPNITYTTASGFSSGLAIFIRCRPYVTTWRAMYYQESIVNTTHDFTGTSTIADYTPIFDRTAYMGNGEFQICPGDMKFLTVIAKPYTVNWATPAGWTKLGTWTSGTAPSGVDTGSVNITIFTRAHVSGDPTTVTLTSSVSATVGSWGFFFARSRFKNYRISAVPGYDFVYDTQMNLNNDEAYTLTQLWATTSLIAAFSRDDVATGAIGMTVANSIESSRTYGGDLPTTGGESSALGTTLGQDLGGAVGVSICTSAPVTISPGLAQYIGNPANYTATTDALAVWLGVEPDTWKAQVAHAPTITATAVLSPAPVEYQITASGASQSDGSVDPLISLVVEGQPGDLTIEPFLRSNSVLAGSVAYDATSTLASGTGTRSWTHTPVGTPRGVLVFTVQGGAQPDQTTAVTYGGVAMTEIAEFIDTSEPGSVTAWFLGTGLGTGAKTIQITRSSTATYIAAAYTVTAGGDTRVLANSGGGGASTTVTSLPTSLAIPANTGAFVAGAVYSGVAAPTSITNLANETDATTVDFGQFSGKITKYDLSVAPNQTFTSFGWTQTSDDASWIGVAIGRVMPTYAEGDATAATSPTSTGTAGPVARFSGSGDLLLQPDRSATGNVLYTYLGSPLLLNASPTLTAALSAMTKTTSATGSTVTPTSAAAGTVTTVYSPGTTPDDRPYQGRNGANPHLRQRQSPYR